MSLRLNVKGIAVRSGLSKNGHRFLPEELAKAAERSKDKTYPLIKDHEATTDNTFGRIKFGAPMVDEKGDTVITHSGFAVEDGSNITMKISEGIINEVSIGAYAEQMVKESEDSNELIPIGIHFAELSTTPTPAVDGTAITRAHIIAKEQSKCPECGAMFPDKEAMQAHMDKKHKESMEVEKMETKEAQAPPAVTEASKVDYKAELAKVQDEMDKFKLEQAKKELETMKASVAKPQPKTASAAEASEQAKLLEGYIVSKGEFGGLAISKPRTKCSLFTD